MIRIACASCRKELAVKENLVGKQIKCPGCGQVQAVPALASVTTKDLPTSPPELPVGHTGERLALRRRPSGARHPRLFRSHPARARSRKNRKLPERSRLP